MNDIMQTLVRSVLKIGAGYFIAKGFLTDSESTEIISSLTALIAVIWGVAHRTNGTPPTVQKSALFAALVVAFAAFAFTGCTYQREVTNTTISNGQTNVQRIVRARLWDGYVIEHSSTLFGADIESPSGQNNGTVKFKLGFGNDYSRYTPTATNEVFIPKYMSSLHIQQGVASTGISGESGSGNVSIGGTNWNASATVPGTPNTQHP